MAEDIYKEVNFKKYCEYIQNAICQYAQTTSVQI